MLFRSHIWLVQAHGMSVPPRIEEDAERTGRRVPVLPFVPHFVLREAFGWTLALALLAALAAFYPWELGVKADPFASAPAGIRPEWYFLWMFQALKYFPGKLFGIEGELVAVGLIGLLAAAAFLVPFWSTNPRMQRVVQWGGVVAIIGMAILTALALRPVPAVHP